MKHGTYRPSRLDHFPNKKALVAWLENHNLPVTDDDGENINTMLKATGGKAIGG